VDAAAPTTLVLSGAACTTWRDSASKKIDLQFPCATSTFTGGATATTTAPARSRYARTAPK
jgi:hypothetical protein